MGPLTTMLSSTKATTSVPCVKAGTWAMLRLVNLNQDRNDKGDMFKWEFALVEPAQKEGGDSLNPGDFGSKIFHTMRMYGKDGLEAAIGRTMTEIGKYMNALLGTGDSGNKENRPERPEIFDQAMAEQGQAVLNPATVAQLVGQVLVADFKLRSDGAGTEIGKVYYPPDKKA